MLIPAGIVIDIGLDNVVVFTVVIADTVTLGPEPERLRFKLAVVFLIELVSLLLLTLGFILGCGFCNGRIGSFDLGFSSMFCVGITEVVELISCMLLLVSHFIVACLLV
jgi:hypothetical protein